MHGSIHSARTGLGIVIVVAAFGGLAGFTHPVRVSPAFPASGVVASPPAATNGATSRAAPVTIVVRDFPSSSTVTVLGWANSAPAYGLRTSLPRRGGAWRYHWLYVATNTVRESGDITKVTGFSRPLVVGESSRDEQNCFGGPCSPTDTFTARIPDDVLRKNVDAVAVTFYTGSGSQLVFSVRRDLVDAYLATVDSVRAALRQP